MSLSTVGNVADLTHDGVVDLRDLAILCDSWLVQRVLLAEDLDRNGRIDESDLAILGLNWRNAPE
jgi:hypothetical protein